MDETPDREEADPDDRRIGDPPETMAREAVDSEVRPWPIQKLSSGDPDLPRAVEVLGQIGIYLGVVAVGLAVVGLVAGALDVFSIAGVALFLSIVLASVGMGLAIVFQIFVIRD